MKAPAQFNPNITLQNVVPSEMPGYNGNAFL